MALNALWVIMSDINSRRHVVFKTIGIEDNNKQLLDEVEEHDSDNCQG